MKIIISGRNVELTDGIKNHINDKLSKFDKFFTNETNATVTLKTEKNLNIAEINIPVKGNLLRVSEKEENLFSAIDIACEKLERQLRKYRTKIRDKKLHTIMKNVEEGGFTDETLEDDSLDIKINKKKEILLNPMSDEEACMHLDMIGHSFFIYQNIDNKTCVVYKRADESFGIIETNK